MEHSIFEIIIVAAVCIAALGYIGYIVYRMFKSPNDEQLEKVRKWLLGQVTNAEKKLGGGTGALKLSLVYDSFLVAFPWLAKVISFELFAELVDDALNVMRDMLEKNNYVAAYVEGAEE